MFFKNGEDHWEESKWLAFVAQFGPTASLKLLYRGPKRFGQGTVTFEKVEDANKLMASADANGKALHTIDSRSPPPEPPLLRRSTMPLASSHYHSPANQPFSQPSHPHWPHLCAPLCSEVICEWAMVR